MTDGISDPVGEQLLNIAEEFVLNVLPNAVMHR